MTWTSIRFDCDLAGFRFDFDSMSILFRFYIDFDSIWLDFDSILVGFGLILIRFGLISAGFCLISA